MKIWHFGLIMLSWGNFSSRKCIGKYLLKLPSVFFPSYRLDNLQLQPGNLEDGSGDHLRQGENQNNRQCIMVIPTPPSFPYHLLNFEEIKINNVVISSQNLKAIVLRKTSRPLRKIETPLGVKVLRNRFKAIHSSTPKRLVFDDDTDELYWKNDSS